MLRRFDGLLAILVLASLVGLVVLLGAPERVTGLTRVVDGDTIEINGRRLRLAGIDAPELGQTCGSPDRPYRCGETARDALRTLIGGGPAHCDVTGRDRYGRDVGTCTVAGRDLGQSLVSRGLAVADRRYLAEERDARSQRIGLWAGPFELPARWRNARREEMPSGLAAGGGLPQKGADRGGGERAGE